MTLVKSRVDTINLQLFGCSSMSDTYSTSCTKARTIGTQLVNYYSLYN